jgi:hypothetical protein
MMQDPTLIKTKLSPQEFDEFMLERTKKSLANLPKDVKGFIMGSYLDLYFKDNILVECAMCGIPLYVRWYIYDVAKERNWPILCLYDSPPQMVKGRIIQDIAAVLQHTGEK